ncbi:hypothetical protein THASP1DRAFT_21124, partial [Thamnocephalis sphaerospora]
ITADDYFAKSTEFRVWLRECKHRYFDDMKSSDAHVYFARFVRVWNRGRLDKKYYEGIRSSQVASSDMTRYQWSFAKKMVCDQIMLHHSML